jgi:hypothetical protein
MAVTADLLRAGAPVWLRNYRYEREEQMRVVIDLGNSVVLCAESDYVLRSVEGRALVGKAYPRSDVRARD